MRMNVSWLVLAALCLVGMETVGAAGPLTKRVAKNVNLAGKNRAEIQRALRAVPANQRDGMEFLVAYMPERDLQQLSARFLLENVEYAYRAWHEAPWKKQISVDMFMNNILPFANVTERRDRWRKDFYTRFQPLVARATSPSQAAAILNQKIFPLLNVHYSRKRRRADQGPLESIETGTASCTGLSILLIDACRAVGVPARFAGTPLWADRSGNHSWVEVWDGGWHFTGAAEPTGAQLDRAWFVGRASKAMRDDRMHAIYAVSYRATPLLFPTVWAHGRPFVHAVNVTDRYTRDQKPHAPGALEVRFRVIDGPGGSRLRCRLEFRDSAGKTLLKAETKDERFDGNDHLATVVPKPGKYQVHVHYGDTRWTTIIDVTTDGQLITLDATRAGT